MDAAQVFGKLVDCGDIDVHSAETKRTTKLLAEYMEEFQKTLSKQQNDMCFNIDMLDCCLSGEYFNDGVLYGLQLAKHMREILDEPQKAFSAFQKQYLPFEKRFEEEIAFLCKYQKREQVAG